MFDKILESSLASKKRSTASIQIGRTRADAVPMATVERNVYDEKTMSVLVTGEPGTDEAETFLQDKLCEQGLKGTGLACGWTDTHDLIRDFDADITGHHRPDIPYPHAYHS